MSDAIHIGGAMLLDHISVREGLNSDLAFLEHALRSSTNGVFNFLYDGVSLAPSLLRDGSAFHLSNWLVASRGGESLGCILSYRGAVRPDCTFDPAIDNARLRMLEHFERPVPPDDVYVSSLFTRTEYRRRGVAQMLLRAAATRHLDHGAQTIGLHVFTSRTAARNLYQKLGFSEIFSRPWPDSHVLEEDADLVYLSVSMDQVIATLPPK